MRWEILLERRTKNRLNADITQRKLRTIAKAAESNPSLGFEGHTSKLREPRRGLDGTEEVYVYATRIVVANNHAVDHEDADSTFRQVILPAIQKQAETDGWGLKSDEEIVAVKTISGLTGNSTYDVPATVLSETNDFRPPFELPVLDGNAHDQFFFGVYEREAHIRMIHDSIRAYVNSGGEQRSHILLEGRPACCKTILFERLKLFYEHNGPPGIERVAFIDGPTMSKAGLENWMMQMAVSGKLPEIVCVEEIEKQNMDNLLTLLSVMGSGYIMKTNARIGRLKELAKCVIWATCNDKQLLRKFRDGALWSRFTHKLHCRRPSKELMTKIVHDKVAKMGGDPRWADAVIQFCYEDVKARIGIAIVDPRAILGLLDGGDRLLDGSYQEDYLATLSSEDGEDFDGDTPIDGAIGKLPSSLSLRLDGGGVLDGSNTLPS